MTLNQREAYYRIRIKEEHEKYTVFKTPYEMYKFRVVLFRLTNTSAKQHTERRVVQVYSSISR